MAKTKGGSKSSNSRKKATRYENIESSSGSEVEFDSNEPFKDDEIESFNKESDKVLLNKINSKNYDSTSDEEVLPFDDDDDDEDDESKMKEIDYDDDNVDYNELTKKSWGQKKSLYYSGNHIENEEDAKLEEEEAQFMQNKIMKQLDLSDFDLDSFKTWKKTGADANNEDGLEKIMKNFDNMKKSEKLEFLKSESPELFELIKDFKEKVKELEEVNIPLFNLLISNKLERNNKASAYVLNKMRMNIMYCCHLCFYFSLKTQKLDVDNHPIIKNILQFKHLCKQTNAIDAKLNDEINFILSSVKSGKKIETLKNNLRNENGRNLNKDLENTDESGMDNEDEGEDEEEDEESIKRPINYQIEKNKGLTPKRNKLCRNPRVKHREKYRKALIKRKSIVPTVRTEIKRYSGETTGIRSNIVKGIKLK